MNPFASFLLRVAIACVPFCFASGAPVLADGMAGAYAREGPLFEDTPVRNAVGNLFILVEGAPGSLMLLIFSIGAIAAAAARRFRPALWLFAGASLTFGARTLINIFFGAEFDP